MPATPRRPYAAQVPGRRLFSASLPAASLTASGSAFAEPAPAEADVRVLAAFTLIGPVGQTVIQHR
ncbi:hypothetical protein [Xylophilus sp. GOD-11R]|uniref:hypothetical protein n=1 Tax=Xylophilus sp. GOD-11R TaxID=3089814 RepID=UPI00298C773E|nr:hypothetical protein [Xylophilus sp. GOD-11R]WPB58793.1 hypothetical protein R9X41_09195 [Xylophilus sp. GOD-11R]